VGQWIGHDLRRAVYTHLQRLSLSYYDKHETGNLISTITDDIEAVEDFASSTMINIAVDILTMIGMLAVMFYLDWDFTLIAIAVTPLLMLFLYRFRHVVKQASREVRKKESEIVNVVEEGITSIRVVQAFARGEYEEKRLEEKSLESVQAAMRARKVKSMLSPFVTIIVAIGTAAVLWYGAHLVLSGKMTAGSLVVFLQYLTQLFKPIQDLAKMTSSIAQAAVGLERIKSVLDADEEIPELPGAKVVTAIKGRIDFEHVAFGYEADHLVLKDVNFTIPAGSMVGFVGATGGGKSTIISLIPRFYDPVKGSVKIDGEDIRNYSLKSLRDQISFVLQDTQLFHATIWENIAYGKPNATREQIVEAAKLANADDFIQKSPKGYDTLVGERGLTLSGGQRQRIGIARALIRNAPMLVLDEPTSGLDAESEKLVLEALERLMKGRTTIVIAHRLVTIRDANLILVLKDGVIAESGTHDQLLAKGGLYAQLHEIQYQEPGAGHAAPGHPAMDLPEIAAATATPSP
jgi:subfamily B ATP-binding cassette protein MsbA